MNEYSVVSFIALLGWLVLCGSALASHKMDWSKGIRMGLTWLAIFGGVFGIFHFVGGG